MGIKAEVTEQCSGVGTYVWLALQTNRQFQKLPRKTQPNSAARLDKSGGGTSR